MNLYIAYNNDLGCDCGMYDFEMKSWSKYPIRNIATIGGKIYNSFSIIQTTIGKFHTLPPTAIYTGGAPFMIRYNGTFKIGK